MIFERSLKFYGTGKDLDPQTQNPDPVDLELTTRPKAGPLC